MTKSLKAIPAFNSEAEERCYWEAHDSTEHLDWSKAHKVTLPKLKPWASQTVTNRGLTCNWLFTQLFVVLPFVTY